MDRIAIRARVAGALAATLGAAMLLASCGGGGSDDEPGPAPFAQTAQAYWVSGTGSRWVYQRTDARTGSNAGPVLKTVTDEGEQTVAGQAVRRFRHTWSLYGDTPEVELRRFDGSAILNVIDLGAAFGVPAPMQAYAEVPAPLVDGATVPIADSTQSADFNGDSKMDSLRIEVRATIGREAVLSTPAGDFRDVLRVRQTVVGTVADGASGQSASATVIQTSWYAAGVGVVKRVFEDPSFSAPGNTVTEVLVGLDAGGRRAGLLPGVSLLDDIGAGGDSRTPGAVGVAVGADRTMTVATRAGSVEGAVRTTDGGLVWRGQVLQAPEGHEFGPLSITFDGSDFRVVAAHRKPFDSLAQTTVRAQRVGVGGALRDGAAGMVLDTGILDTTQTVGALRTAAQAGRLLVAWGRYDTTYVPVAPGLVTQRGYVVEGRLYGADNAPLAPAFALSEGLPAAVGVRDDQFIVVPTQQVISAAVLRSWAVSAVDGVPVDPAGTVIDERLLARNAPTLQRVGDELWVSYGSYPEDTLGQPSPTITLARLGRNGVLLDGTPAAPGRALVGPDAARGWGVAGLGGASNVLTWVEGWNTVKGTFFDASVLAGTTGLPSTSSTLTVGDPLQASGGPSRSMLWAGPAGAGTMVVWLDNEQSAETPSDRVSATLILPRLPAP